MNLQLQELDTLFYTAMKNYKKVFVITESYTIDNKTFPCVIFEQSDDLEKILDLFTNVYDSIKERHLKTYKVKSMIEDNIKEIYRKPIDSVCGYIVIGGEKVSSFSFFDRRDKYELVQKRNGLFKGKTLEKEKIARYDNEFETDDFYFSLVASRDPLEDKDLEIAKNYIVKHMDDKIDFNSEMVDYYSIERKWEGILKSKEIPFSEYHNFMEEIDSFLKHASPDGMILFRDMMDRVYGKKSLFRQYEMMLRLRENGVIYND